MHRSSINHLLLAIAAAVVLFACGCERPAAGERAVPTPGDIVVERAMFGAGCFWSVQEKFRTVEGVIATAVGYAGGHAEKPTYEEVCTNRTGHAEVVFIEYDPALVSYEALLEVFWQCHDPTTPNQPGPSGGSQYRSVIFYYDEAQHDAALASRQALDASGTFDRPIVTAIVPAAPFWRAEDYHQLYLQKRALEACG